LQVMSDMRRIMDEQSRSPMMINRRMGLGSLGTPNGSGVFPSSGPLH